MSYESIFIITFYFVYFMFNLTYGHVEFFFFLDR